MASFGQNTEDGGWTRYRHQGIHDSSMETVCRIGAPVHNESTKNDVNQSWCPPRTSSRKLAGARRLQQSARVLLSTPLRMECNNGMGQHALLYPIWMQTTLSLQHSMTNKLIGWISTTPTKKWHALKPCHCARNNNELEALFLEVKKKKEKLPKVLSMESSSP